jgi:hypothetical protein
VSEQRPRKGKPNPERVAILRSLPLEIKEQVTGEEAEAFMYDEDPPASLLEKLKKYLVKDEPTKNHTATNIKKGVDHD